MRSHSQKWLLTVACGAPFLVALDLFVVNVAFDQLAHEFPGSGLGTISWTLSAYAITFAALLVPLGSWSDRVGNRRGFITGVLVFTAGSALAAAAPTLGVLIGARVLQAVGAAALTPASMSLLVTSLPAHRRAAGMRIWAATSGMAAALGPVVGGVLVEISWRMAFVINVPLGIAFVLLALGVFAKDPASAQRRRAPGSVVRTLMCSVLLGAASALAVLYLINGDSWGWGSPSSIAVLVAAVLSAAVFVVADRRAAEALVPRQLFDDRRFTFGTIAMLIFSVAFAAGLLNAILLLQQDGGYSVLLSGLAIAPGPLMVPVVTVLVGRRAAHISPWPLAALGSLIWAAGSIVIGVSTSIAALHGSYAACFLPGWLLGGIGVGLTIPALLAGATQRLSMDMAARGSAVVTMGRQFGTTIGTSVLVAVLAGGLARCVSWWIIAAIAGAAALVAYAGVTVTTPAGDPLTATTPVPGDRRDPSNPRM
ncbi:MFS transporter [Gordonia sp. NPDC003950]